MLFKDELKKQFHLYGLSYTEEQIEKFNTFYAMLIEKNKVMNLTAITEPQDVALKHMVDSLSAYDEKYFSQGARLIDIGTGAGFPGIPLAIMHPELEIVLFDSLKKRLHFLDEVIQSLGLHHVSTLHGRAEELAHNLMYREQFDIATSRAVARLPILLEWSMGFVKTGGYFVSLKGAAYEEECLESKKALHILGSIIEEVRPVHLPGLTDKRAIVYIKKEKNMIKKYPRKPKDIKINPL